MLSMKRSFEFRRILLASKRKMERVVAPSIHFDISTPHGDFPTVLSPYLLAKQMGTSVDMLERFYGHVMTTEVADEVTKGNQRF